MPEVAPTEISSSAVHSRLGTPEVHPVVASDGTELKLTRFRGGGKGPIMLAPGYGNAARAFALDTVDQSFTEYLTENGYDVWLFDFRSSPEVPASRTQFTVDDIARRDWPAAVAKVREETGEDSVQVLAHCVGSLSFVMSLLDGLEGVRQGVCSQLGAHPIPTVANRLRAGAHMAEALHHAGVDGLDTDFDPHRLDARLLDAVMKVSPGQHRHCDSPVCRRISFIYGDVYSHAHLNAPTHKALEDIFGPTNMTFFEHISKMVRAGQAVDADGNDTYLPNVERLALPITFLHGEHNRMFLPESTETTYDLVREANGQQWYQRHLIGGYAHLDCWLGERAREDVYPVALRELEKYN